MVYHPLPLFENALKLVDFAELQENYYQHSHSIWKKKDFGRTVKSVTFAENLKKQEKIEPFSCVLEDNKNETSHDFIIDVSVWVKITHEVH